MLIGIDIGGTFTDLVIYDEGTSKVEVIKVPTTSDDPKRSVIDVLKEKKDLAGKTSIIFHATTIATNALLTKVGLPKVALLTTKGFRDVLEIGRQRRAEIYNLYNSRPEPLVKRNLRFTVRERIDAEGNEIEKIDIDELKTISRKIVRNRIDALAISFLNSYKNPSHETVAEEIVREVFKGHISISSNVNPEYREYERTSTTVVNATLAPIVSSYLDQLTNDIKGIGYHAPVYVMNSSGGNDNVKFASKYPISIIESGPAAGVLASKYLANTISMKKVITFDMGGTTAKAGTILDGNPDISYEFEAAGKTHSGRSIKGSGYVVRHAFIDLAEASAGGGTIAWIDEGGALRVGPKSAGSQPGPASYGRGGISPTITDAHVVLGHLNPEFLLSGQMRVYKDLAFETINKLAEKLGINAYETAEGIIKLINNSMSKTISIVSVERGRDPRDFGMIAFGGAGPLHACDMADDLHISDIVIPLHPGLFSAFGLLTSDIVRTFSAPIMSSDVDIADSFLALEQKAIQDLKEDNLNPSTIFRFVEMRYHGQSYMISIPYENQKDLREKFDKKHKELYGYYSGDPVDIVNIRVQAIVEINKVRLTGETTESSEGKPDHFRDVSFDGKFENVPIYKRESLRPGNYGEGPCIIEEYDSTTKVNRQWKFTLDEYSNIRIRKVVS